MTNPQGVRRVVTALVACAGAIFLSGCLSTSAALNPNNDPCFRTLAVAANSIGHQGRYTGVRYLSASSLRAILAHANRLGPSEVSPELAGASGALCAVIYRGSFARAQLEHPWPPGTARGNYAMVIVPIKTEKVNTTFLFDHLPLHSRRTFHILG